MWGTPLMDKYQGRGASLRGFRSKMIMLLGLSMLCSGTITYGLYRLLQFFYRDVRREDFLAQVRRIMFQIGDIYCFLIIFIPLVILFFFWFSKPYSDYFKQISTGIRALADGDFNHRVHIESGDEFAVIAEDLNLAGLRLEEAVSRGDFAESSKDQLVVNLAHDLRTPLTSVLGYLDLVIKDKQLTEEQVQHFISIAYTKSQHLERLIEGLFEITRMNYGKLTIKQEQVNISELLYQLHEELYPVLEKHHLTARLEVEPQLLTVGDGELLARVFENLLTNACRYGSDGIYVDIKGLLEDESSIRVQVINYGSSIKQEDIPHIFDMYFRGDRVRSSQGGGTGLGLFIAKNIVEQHGGTIAVTSDAISTCFEVILPRSIVNLDNSPIKI